MEEVFVDTGAWIALADRDDDHHQEAAPIYPELLRRYGRLVTSNLVVSEVYVILRRALGHREAVSFLERTKASPRVEKVYSTEDLEEEATSILNQYADQDFSLTDAVSFALMRRRRIGTAFAFDRHFMAAGFLMVPETGHPPITS